MNLAVQNNRASIACLILSNAKHLENPFPSACFQSGLDISKMIIYKRRQEAKEKRREKRAARRAKRKAKREVPKKRSK